MKLYGSLINRLEEGRTFTGDGLIHVGDGVTEYYYSDREPWEVIEVFDQGHVIIRKLDAKRIDNNGMSEDQEYEYISNKDNCKKELQLSKKGIWQEVLRYEPYFLKNKEIDQIINCRMTEKERERNNNGKEIVKRVKTDNRFSFGVARKYYDFSF